MLNSPPFVQVEFDCYLFTMTMLFQHVQGFVKQVFGGCKGLFGGGQGRPAGRIALCVGWIGAEMRAKEHEEGNELERVREAEQWRFITMGSFAERKLACIHGEVVKRLRRKRYKAGWSVSTNLRILPVIWSALHPEFSAAGANVATIDRCIVTFIDLNVLCSVFFDRLVGHSKFCQKYDGVFAKYFSPNKNYPHCAVVVEPKRPFVLQYCQGKCELAVSC